MNIETDCFLLLCKRNKMEKTQRSLFMFIGIYRLHYNVIPIDLYFMAEAARLRHGLLEYPDGKLSFIVKFYWGHKFDFVISQL